MAMVKQLMLLVRLALFIEKWVTKNRLQREDGLSTGKILNSYAPDREPTMHFIRSTLRSRYFQ